jgi:hypothetical protein
LVWICPSASCSPQSILWKSNCVYCDHWRKVKCYYSLL